MKKISREDLNTIRKAVKHITEYIQSGRGGGRCYGCPVSSSNNRLGTACRVFINDIGENELIGVKCKDLIGCSFRLETMKYILKNHNKGCKI